MVRLSKTRTRPRLSAFAFWSVIILACSTGIELQGRALPWQDSLLRALAAWGAWVVLVPLIVRADRVLPVSREALVPRLLWHLPLSVGFTAAFIYLFAGAAWVLHALAGRMVFDGRPETLSLQLAWLVYWVIVAGCIATEYQDLLRDRKVRTAELERLLADSRLDMLRSQLQPHFLFNALNAISAHVEGAPRTARWMLEQLGDLLRLSLDHADEQEIPLQQELAFVDRYMKLQKIRYEDRLDVFVDAEPLALRALVPPFILQPLLENSIRHGIAARPGTGLIEIQAWCQRDSLHLSVRDDGPGLPPEWSLERAKGVGLSNTQERLRRLYGAEHTFNITGNLGAGVVVDLTFPLRHAVPPPAAVVDGHDSPPALQRAGRRGE